MWFYDLLFLIWYSTWQFYNYFYIDTEFKSPYPLPSSSPFPESLSSVDNSLSDTIFSLISTVTQGKCGMKINKYL